MSDYTLRCQLISLPDSDWRRKQSPTGKPDYPIHLFHSPSGHYQIEINPKFEDDSIRFVVNVYEYQTYDEDSESWTDYTQTLERQFQDAEAAVEKVQAELQKQPTDATEQ